MEKILKKALYGLAALATVWCVALDSHVLTLATRILIALLSMAAIHLGLRKHRPAVPWRSYLKHPDPWLLLASGLGFFVFADLLDLAHAPALLHTGAKLVTLAFTLAGLVGMMRQRFGDRTTDHLFESVITAGTIALVAWVGIVEPLVRSNNQTVAFGAANAVGLLLALLLAALSLNLLHSFNQRPEAMSSVAAAMIMLVVSSVLGFVAQVSGLHLAGAIALALPTIGIAFMGAGALDSSMAVYEEPSGPAGARLSRTRLVALILPVLVGPIALTLCLINMISLSPLALAMFSISLSMLVVTHLINMVQARASSTHWASHDKLTGLPNRALFRERTAQALERSRKLGTSVAVLYLDLDRFKQINDSMGHEVGDQLLEQVARRILTCVDVNDTVARLGGDEFAILLPSITDSRIPRMLARRLLKTFSTPFNLRPRPVFMSPSIGIAVGEPGINLETLLMQADTAMYRAKESGRNNFAVWSQEMNEAAKQRLMLETHLHTAVTNNELRLVYQPKVELATGAVVGVEALLRWHHPKLGTISPGVFIHLAEETGLINQIGEWVLDEACRQAKAWSDSGFANLTMAVNLSSRQFQNQQIADTVSRVLRQTGLNPELLELELTESLAMNGEDATISTLQELRSMGVKTSIDDFGTGYSNLSYLSRFPIDTLKIDRSFIEQIDKSGGDAAIVVAIIAMAHGLGLNVIAEGVETPQQAAFLSKHECDQMQGYLFSRALPPEQIEGLLMLEHVAGGSGRLGISGNSRRIERSMPASERIAVPSTSGANAIHFRPEPKKDHDDDDAPVGRRFRS